MISRINWGKISFLVAIGFVVLLAINLSACSKREATAPAPVPKATAPAPAPAPEVAAPAPAPLDVTTKSNLESYSVTVSANEQLTIPGPPGELRVWIGISSNAPRIQPGMSTETRELETVGETAKVKPFALGIDVASQESICERIDPSGSEVRFKLMPIKPGVFTVGADVELYNSTNCSGTPVPKSAKSVEVKVKVDNSSVISQSIGELLDRAWKAFLDFWDKILFIFFALMLFLLRKKLYKWFGFESKE